MDHETKMDSRARSANGENSPLSNRTTATNSEGSKLLVFVANADAITISGVLLGSSAVLYIMFGRVSLIFSGFVIGILTYAYFDHALNSHSSGHTDHKRRKEVGVDIVRRLLDRKEESFGKSEENSSKSEIALKIATGQRLDFSGFPAPVAIALSNIVEAVICDYVKFWYEPVLPSEDQFPNSARETLTAFVLAFGNHQARRRPAEALLTFLTNATSVFIVFLHELSVALMSEGGLDMELEEALQTYLQNYPDSSLNNIVDINEQKKRMLAAADDFLQSFLDHKTYNCPPARIFLQRVFSGVVLESILTSISKPEWLNTWIVYLLEDGEPELLNAIDVGVERATVKAKDAVDQSNTVDVKLNAKQKVQPSDFTDTEAHMSVSPKKSLSQGQSPVHSKDQNRDHTNGSAMEAAESQRSTQTVLSHSDDTSGNTIQQSASRTSYEHLNASDPPAPHRVGDAEILTSDEISEKEPFTNFDQIVPHYKAVPEDTRANMPVLTLHRAKISLFDDAPASDKQLFKAKPQIEYLIQIEPFLPAHSGWMVARLYSEFEPLHEYLYKIANVSGVSTFVRRYQYLPPYKGKTKDTFRQEIEVYLNFALSYEILAESEGLKRFLDKDQGFTKLTGNTNALKFAAPVGDAFQTVGKGVLGGFNTATKGMAAGGQAVIGGVGGLFSGQKKGINLTRNVSTVSSRDEGVENRQSIEKAPSRVPTVPDPGLGSARTSNELRPRSSQSLAADDIPESHRKSLRRPSEGMPSPKSEVDSLAVEPDLKFAGDKETSRKEPVGSTMNLMESTAAAESERLPSVLPSEIHVDSSTSPYTQPNAMNSSMRSELQADPDLEESPAGRDDSRKTSTPLNEQETQIAIELIFAAVNELFALSSAWNIRRTLLNAAKNYLLKPGNASLLSIRDLLQTKLDENLSPDSIASNLFVLRQNALPTVKELEQWPPPLTTLEQENLRSRARKLLLDRGMPQALSSVMGGPASREALGRLFDALQVESINRGVMFAMLMQVLRIVIH